MNTTHIYLIRHGESEGNKSNLFLGHTDLDITEKGHAQAEMTAEFLKDIKVDAIYSSDLKRAYNTGLHTAKQKGMEIVKDENLREIFAGEWENRLFEDIVVEYEEDFKVWKKNIGRARCTGGESVEELLERFVSEVKKIAKENEGKTIFIFTHATPIRVLKAALDGLSLDEIQSVPWASNASVTHVVSENGKLKLVDYSIDHFMGDLATFLPKSV